MKVIRVEPGSPAQKAGIEIGDVIVAANGVPVTGVEVLSAVLKKSGPSLTVTVRDTRSGRDVPVEVKVGGPDAGTAAPIPADTPIPAGTGRKLGAVTELVFYDVNPAVKVTEVEPNSPAARAGIEPGDIIIEANGTPVLHPKTLEELVRKSAANAQTSGRRSQHQQENTRRRQAGRRVSTKYAVLGYAVYSLVPDASTRGDWLVPGCLHSSGRVERGR